MTTVEILTEHLERHGGETATVVAGNYTLRVVAGRPGSICFTLEQVIGPDTTVVLAEGFSLDGALRYHQRTIPAVEVERLMRDLVVGPQPIGATLRSRPIVHWDDLVAGK